MEDLDLIYVIDLCHFMSYFFMSFDLCHLCQCFPLRVL